MDGKIETLKRSSLCGCGFPFLDESIQPGVRYRTFPETPMADFADMRCRCGGCGAVYKLGPVVMAAQLLHPDLPPAPLPVKLFQA